MSRGTDSWLTQPPAGAGGQGVSNAGNPSSSIREGGIVGDYEIMEEIGAGGVGRVYRARHRHMDRIVALKILAANMTGSEEAVRRFLREVKSAAKLLHPHIVTAFDAGQVGDSYYLVMEYIAGTDLEEVVSVNGPLNLNTAVDFTIQAARGLEYAHTEGLVHRDIKPSNLMLDHFGVVKILDMGLARQMEGNAIQNTMSTDALTQFGAAMGTVGFMAPEQSMNAKGVDYRADIYSLGCTLYYLITGEPVYKGNLAQIVMAHLNEPVPSLAAVNNMVSPHLDAVFQKMLAKEPAHRYQSMHQAMTDLRSCILEAPPQTPVAPSIVNVPSAPPASQMPTGQFGSLPNQAPNQMPAAQHGTQMPTGQFGAVPNQMPVAQPGPAQTQMPTGHFGVMPNQMPVAQPGPAQTQMPTGQFGAVPNQMPVAQPGPAQTQMPTGQFGAVPNQMPVAQPGPAQTQMPTGQFGAVHNQMPVAQSGPAQTQMPTGQFGAVPNQMPVAQPGPAQTQMPTGQFGSLPVNATPSHPDAAMPTQMPAATQMPTGQFGSMPAQMPPSQAGATQMPTGQFGAIPTEMPSAQQGGVPAQQMPTDQPGIPAMIPQSGSPISQPAAAVSTSVSMALDIGSKYIRLATLDTNGKPKTFLNSLGKPRESNSVYVDGANIATGAEAKDIKKSTGVLVTDLKQRLGKEDSVVFCGETNYPPEALLAMLINRSSVKLQKPEPGGQRVVMTVPVSSNSTQREAYRNTGVIAGFNVVDLVNDTTAAAFWHGWHKGLFRPDAGKPSKVCVVHLGASTIGVSICEISLGSLKVLASVGDSQLGGVDWDDCIMQYIAESFIEQCGVDPREGSLGKRHLPEFAMSTKHRLSMREEASLNAKFNGTTLQDKISRAAFKKISKPLLDRVKDIVEDAMQQANCSWKEIAELLTVGEATRMPMIHELLCQISSKEPKKLAEDALVQGTLLYGNHAAHLGGGSQYQVDVREVSTVGIGVEAQNRKTKTAYNALLILNGTELPATIQKSVKTSRQDQESINLRLVQGNSNDMETCQLLGECEIPLENGLPAGTSIPFVLQISRDGTVHVYHSLSEAGSGISIPIQPASGLTQSGITRWIDWLETALLCSD